jgi:hypothetical protein
MSRSKIPTTKQTRIARPLMVVGWPKEVIDGVKAAEQELRAQDYADNQPDWWVGDHRQAAEA